jgi:hypothetical protein
MNSSPRRRRSTNPSSGFSASTSASRRTVAAGGVRLRPDSGVGVAALASSSFWRIENGLGPRHALRRAKSRYSISTRVPNHT